MQLFFVGATSIVISHDKDCADRNVHLPRNFARSAKTFVSEGQLLNAKLISKDDIKFHYFFPVQNVMINLKYGM